MTTFEINGKEYELKLTYKSIQLLNGLFEGGSYELIGKAIQGDFESFPRIVHAALLHTGQNFPLTAVEDRIEEMVDNGEVSMEDIWHVFDAVVTQSFFYAATVEKMLRQNPDLAKALEQLRG